MRKLHQVSVVLSRFISSIVFTAGTVLVLLQELVTLRKIFAHAAATNPIPLPLSYAVIAALPLLALLAAYVLPRRVKLIARDARAFLGAWISGVGGTFVALEQYSDSTPGLLLIAYFGQWLIVAWYCLFGKARKPKT
jgi:hypothetical protein